RCFQVGIDSEKIARVVDVADILGLVVDRKDGSFDAPVQLREVTIALQEGVDGTVRTWLNQGSRIQIQSTCTEDKSTNRRLHIDHAEAGANYGLAGAEDVIRKAKARRNIAPVGLVGLVDSVADLKQSAAGNKVGQTVLRVGDRTRDVPAQSEVQAQAPSGAEVVLHEEPERLHADIPRRIAEEQFPVADEV